MAVTVMDVLSNTVKKHPKKTAIRFKSKGAWQEISWTDHYKEIKAFARGMCALGLEKQEAVVILSFNCREWVLADLASICAGGVPAGIYPTNSSDQCAFIINHCKASVAIVEDQKQLQKLLSIRDQLPSLKFIVMIRGTSQKKDVYTWNDVLKKSKDFSEEELEKRMKAQKPEDLATLVYTSGTTANPKAVMMSHDNLTWVSESCIQYDLEMTEKDEMISYLPLSHIAEQLTSIHGPVFSGACVSFAESLEKLSENMQEIRPTLFLGVPRVWEKIQEKMTQKMSQASFLKKKMATWAQSVGLKYAENPQHFKYKIADKLVFSKVKKALGLDRCHFQATAAAPISKETLEFFLSMGISLYEIYGMSECTGPATVSSPAHFKLASAGKCIKGAELKIAEDGEILVRGRHVFMGYLNDLEATQKTIDGEGWLHSGDIGNLDKDGFLHVTGRKKNLIITAGGENIAPEMIENKIKNIPEIEQAVVVGDRKKFLTALVTLSPEALDLVKKKHIPTQAQSIGELSSCTKFYEYMHQQMQDSVNSSIARVQTVKNFKVLSNPFSEETGELTPTMKVKRAKVIEKYASEIEAMY